MRLANQHLTQSRGMARSFYRWTPLKVQNSSLSEWMAPEGVARNRREVGAPVPGLVPVGSLEYKAAAAKSGKETPRLPTGQSVGRQGLTFRTEIKHNDRYRTLTRERAVLGRFD